MRSNLDMLWALALFAVLVAAIDPCCNVDPNSVNAATRNEWCTSEKNVCNTVCGSPQTNECDPSTFDYTCICESSFQPNISDYANSLPSFECAQWVSNCLEASSGDAEAEASCQKVVCGNKKASAVSIASSGSGPSSAASNGNGPTSSASSGVSSQGTSKTSSSTTSVGSTSSIRTSTPRSTSSSSPTTSGSGPAAQSGTSNNGNTHGSPMGKSTGLSTGAKAGIAVGVLLAVAAFGGILFFCLRKKKNRDPGPRSFWYHRSTVHGGAPELETKEKPGELWGSKFHHTTDRELQGAEIHQAPAAFPVGHPHSRDMPTDAARPAENAAHVELPTEAEAQDDPSRSLDGPSAPSRVQAQNPGSPFAGAGPVPTHLPETEYAADHERIPLAPANTVVENPSAERSSTTASLPTLDTSGGEDELARLKAELEQVRQERDRLKLIESLSTREEELQRAIQAREVG